MPLPLEGVTVVDFSTLLPGPLATFILAEAGAEVIKVERPGGEDLRSFEPRLAGVSAPFAMLNGGKKSVAVDLRSPHAVALLTPLIARADVLVEQFRPGVMERLGLGYDAVRRINPRLIYCSISGYGQSGPRAGEAGHDLNYQAVTGLLSLSPGSADAPTVPPALAADIGGGSMPAVINILLALRGRDHSGEGCHLDVAMADTMFTFAWLALAQGFATGRYPGAGETILSGGSPRYALYVTADGRFLALGALEQKFWDNFCHAIGLAEPLRDDAADPAGTRRAVAEILRTRPAAAWMDVVHDRDCCCTVVASLEEALADPQFRQRGLFEVEAQAGAARLPAVPIPVRAELRRTSASPRPVPAPGEHRLR
jgi:alpha-methylacyl-CoA racemase